MPKSTRFSYLLNIDIDIVIFCKYRIDIIEIEKLTSKQHYFVILLLICQQFNEALVSTGFRRYITFQFLQTFARNFASLYSYQQQLDATVKRHCSEDDEDQSSNDGLYDVLVNSPSLVVGHLGPFLRSDAAARDGRDARDWLTGLATVGAVCVW